MNISNRSLAALNVLLVVVLGLLVATKMGYLGELEKPKIYVGKEHYKSPNPDLVFEPEKDAELWEVQGELRPMTRKFLSNHFIVNEGEVYYENWSHNMDAPMSYTKNITIEDTGTSSYTMTGRNTSKKPYEGVVYMGVANSLKREIPFAGDYTVSLTAINGFKVDSSMYESHCDNLNVSLYTGPYNNKVIEKFNFNSSRQLQKFNTSVEISEKDLRRHPKFVLAMEPRDGACDMLLGVDKFYITSKRKKTLF